MAGREREIYGLTGEPWALELFAPHWSLATSLPDAEAWARFRDLALERTGLFTDEATRTLAVGSVELVERGADGYFTLAESYPLSG